MDITKQKPKKNLFLPAILMILFFISLPQNILLQANDEEIESLKPIGSACEENSDCITDKCQNSDLKISKNDFCVCNEDTDCNDHYKLISPTETFECKKGVKASHELNYCSSNERNNMFPINSDEIIKAVELQARKATVQKQFTAEAPKINVPFDGQPQLQPYSAKPGETITLPWVAQYLSAMYKWGVTFSTIVAVIMLLIGGILYLSAGFSSENVNTAKSIIFGSILGLIILISSYLILNIINPNLTKFKTFDVYVVETEDWDGDIHTPANFKKCTGSEPGLKSIKDVDVSQLEPVRRFVTEDGKKKLRVVCQPTFANCIDGQVACWKACLAQLPDKQRSRLNGSYNDKYLGQMDCNTGDNGKARTKPLTVIGLHEGAAGSGALTHWWKKNVTGSPVSSHYFITRSGTIYQVMEEKYRAIHGVNNSVSIGIDFVPACYSKKEAQDLNPPLAVWQTCRYTDATYDALADLIKDIKSRHPITQVLGHCQAPSGNHIDPRNFNYNRIKGNNDVVYSGKYPKCKGYHEFNEPIPIEKLKGCCLFKTAGYITAIEDKSYDECISFSNYDEWKEGRCPASYLQSPEAQYQSIEIAP